MNERQAKKKSGSGAVYFAVIAALTVLTALLVISIFFRVSQIGVEGATVYTSQEIIEVSGIRLDESIFFLNESAAAVAIKSTLGYVDEVRIKKELPGTVIIEVTESTAVAAVKGSGGLWIIDENCKILERRDLAEVPGLIDIRGAELVMPSPGSTAVFSENSELRVAYLQAILREFCRTGITGDVSELDTSNLSGISFLYRGEVTVNLGRGDNVQDKLYFLARAMDNHPDGGRAKVDLSDGVSAHYIAQ